MLKISLWNWPLLGKGRNESRHSLLKLLELLWKLLLFAKAQALPKNFLLKPLEESLEILDVHVAEVGHGGSW